LKKVLILESSEEKQSGKPKAGGKKPAEPNKKPVENEN
jgi:hypothetical protein